MGIPVAPPQPPAQPPIEQPVNQTNKQQQDQLQKQQQDQQQKNNQYNSVGELLQKQQTESDADSSADSTSVNSANLTNVQVNNTSNRVEYGSFKIPETTLNINGYVTERGDFGGVVGINIPIGGRSRKSIGRALDIQVQADQLAFEQSYSSVCANINDGGYVVTRNAQTLELLSKCNSNIVARHKPIKKITPPAPPKVDVNISNEINILRQENAELKAQLALLIARLDAQPVNGGY